jgi:hypothetical protein
MKLKLFSCGILLAAAGMLVAQRPRPAPVLVGDDGAVVPEHQTVHRKKGDTVDWGRRTAGQRTWYVKFDESPCAEGAEFGHDRGTSCTISVACNKAGDAACKSYRYRSALSAREQMHDPIIIVDPLVDQ